MGVNLNDKLLQYRRKHITDSDVLGQVYKILENDDNQEATIELNLSKSHNTKENKFNFDLLETEKIFHLEDIKSICITYRLRFLDSSLFKAEIPREAINKIKQLEKTHSTSLKGFKIMAPSKLFKLKNYDDPLMFVPIRNDYYYLVHKWGNDLSIFRKWMMMPFKNFETLLVAALLFSFLVSLVIPNSQANYKESPINFFILFLFMFKSVIGIIIYYAFAAGKNFNNAIWDSRYVNA
jgi:hypothetical protein